MHFPRIRYNRKILFQGGTVLFRKTIVAALTFSLALGWSPASYRAYADTQASAEMGSHSQSVEQNTASGGVFPNQKASTCRFSIAHFLL